KPTRVVQVLGPNLQALTQTQSCRIQQTQQQTRTLATHRRQKPRHLFGRPNLRQTFQPFAIRQSLHHILARTCYLIEEPQGTDRLVVLHPRSLFLVQKMQKIPVDLLGIQLLGRSAVELRKFAHLQNIGLDGLGGAVAQLQIFDETLPQRCHHESPRKKRNAGAWKPAAASMDYKRQKRKSLESLQADLEGASKTPKSSRPGVTPNSDRRARAEEEPRLSTL